VWAGISLTLGVFQETACSDIILNFPESGMHLRFEPVSQRLRLIEVYDLSRMQIRYAQSLVGGASNAATFVRIYDLFGPTFPGELDTHSAKYTLHYPGLSFVFPLPREHASQLWEAELPLEFPDGTTPVATRICIYSGTLGKLMALQTVEPPPIKPGSLYFEQVTIALEEGINFEVSRHCINFGCSPQDVWAMLGCPSATYSKAADTMAIHSGQGGMPQGQPGADYFYNYFSRGMDLLFCGKTHRLKKIVLHTNPPGHSEFNIYAKCNFYLPINLAATAQGCAAEGSAHVDVNGQDIGRHDISCSAGVSADVYPLDALADDGGAWDMVDESAEEVENGVGKPPLAPSTVALTAESDKGGATPQGNDKLQSTPVAGNPTVERLKTVGSQSSFCSSTDDSETGGNDSGLVLPDTTGTNESTDVSATAGAASVPATNLSRMERKRLKKNKKRAAAAVSAAASAVASGDDDEKGGDPTPSAASADTDCVVDAKSSGGEEGGLPEVSSHTQAGHGGLDAALDGGESQPTCGDARIAGGFGREVHVEGKEGFSRADGELTSMELPSLEAYTLRGVITADSTWEEVQALLGPGGRATIHTSGSVSNPFGPTYVYGYRGVVFEVMRNGRIASVTLFQP